ncbi:Gfo/Idh/MocA family oxidoreductase [Palleronia sp. LCG004]|uniref:Gfo/Idh/MocA family protein n=1 Tax=Palleronia sp. LCG004 TaxID=3079304 RepID=UPI002941CDB9|nr:Gfo/Idh/MocA family oxidoreductase [Palleronia sp. LCG004]WOI55892.1 Gfo/Idh/MocA family oxidoreductase [Palleronia sp. LCG004]
MKTYRVAVIGLGVGRGHIEEAWASLPGKFELAVVCDLDRERRESVAETYGCEASDDFDAVIARDDIDIVDICTPPALHVAQVKAVLAAGKHAICEKPLAASLDEVGELERAEEEARGVLMPVFQYRFGSGAMAARRIIDEGIAGKPLVATAETHWFRDAAYFDNPWRGTLKAELGGTMTTHAIHIHDMMCWLMGPVSGVFGRMATRVHAIETEDTASASVAFASGAMGSISACTASQDEFSRLFMAFEHVSFETTRAPYAVGRGPWTITARDPDLQARCDEIAAECAEVPERFAGQMTAFHEALEAGAPPPVGVGDARDAIAFLTAFYRSAATRSEVALPLAQDDPARAGWLAAAE